MKQAEFIITAEQIINQFKKLHEIPEAKELVIQDNCIMGVMTFAQDNGETLQGLVPLCDIDVTNIFDLENGIHEKELKALLKQIKIVS